MIAGSANKHRIGRLPIFALSRPRNLGSFFSFFFFFSSCACSLPASHPSLPPPPHVDCRWFLLVASARARSETRLNSFRFTSSFRFFCQIFTDLGFFARRRPRNRHDFFSRLSAEIRYRRFPPQFPQYEHNAERLVRDALQNQIDKRNRTWPRHTFLSRLWILESIRLVDKNDSHVGKRVRFTNTRMLSIPTRAESFSANVDSR